MACPPAGWEFVELLAKGVFIGEAEDLDLGRGWVLDIDNDHVWIIVVYLPPL